LGSYGRKISKRRIICSAVLTGVFLILICMSLFLEGKAYYIFATNTPLGTLLYIASMFRYLEEENVAIILDISYLVALIGMICSVAISIKKPKAIRLVYALSIFDIIVGLLSFNIFRLIGDIVIIALTIFSSEKTGDGLREPF